MPLSRLLYQRHLLFISAVAAPLILLCVLGFLSHRSQTDQEDSSRWVAHTLRVKASVWVLLALIKDAETSQRGYLLTKDLSFLESYESALQNIPNEFSGLRRLTADNPHQQDRLMKLEPMITAKRDVMAGAVALLQKGNLQDVSELLHRGQSLMKQIQENINQLDTEEERLLTIRQERLNRSARTHMIESWLTISMAFGGVIVVFLLLRHAHKMEAMAVICAWSKTIRYQEEWMSIEEYLSRRFGITSTHSISPAEMEKMLGSDFEPALPGEGPNRA